MVSLQHKSNFGKRNFEYNFNGGDLSTDGGLLLFYKFAKAIGLRGLIETTFVRENTRTKQHSDANIILQMLFSLVSGYKTGLAANHLADDPAFKLFLNQERLASQPTISRFTNNLSKTTLAMLAKLDDRLRKRAYLIEEPKHIILDIDSTLFPIYGEQEGKKFNFHYKAVGLHPLLCFDSFTGDLIASELRDGSSYCSNGAAEFLKPILEKLNRQPGSPTLLVRGDSGFAAPAIYEQCEAEDCYYVIRLKENPLLVKEASELETQAYAMARKGFDNPICYGEFDYQAKTWTHPRKVVCKVELKQDKNKQNSLFPSYTFVVTNMKGYAKNLIKLYCKRGLMENYIKEFKNEFCMSMSNHSMTVNANILELCKIAYNLFNYMKRIGFKGNGFEKMQAAGIRLRVLKVAGKVVFHGRKTQLKLCSSFPCRRQMEIALNNIRFLGNCLQVLL